MLIRALLSCGLLILGVGNAVAGQPMCVFMIGGQSNAVGFGDSSQSIVPPDEVVQFKNGAMSSAADPVGGADTGSFAPAFGSTFYSLTGKPVLIVPAAANGSAQIGALGNANWDTSGTLVPAALTTAKAAIDAARSAGYEPRMCGMLWAQGETEGLNWNSSPGTVIPDYLTSFANMVMRFRTVYPDMPVFIIQTGSVSGDYAKYEPGFAAIRAAQEERARADSRTPIISRLAVGFAARGLLNDGVHYSQAALNELGDEVARNVVASGLWIQF